MLRNGLTKFQMAFPQTLETENSDSDWSASLNIPAEFRNDQSQEEPDAVILYREYNFQLTESNIPEVGRRISVSIRRINLPKKMGEIDFED